MVFLNLVNPASLTAREIGNRLAERGIKVGVVGSQRFRLVTHYGIGDEDIERAIAAFGEVL